MNIAELRGERHFATILLSEGQTLNAEFALRGRDTYLKLYGSSDSAYPVDADTRYG
jgi:hypothetical protein